MEYRPAIVVMAPDDATWRLWLMVLRLAEKFGAETEWTLVGGLIVQLHGFEHDDDPRPTADIDVLAGARKPPKMTETMAVRLVELGATVADPPRSNPKLGYRFNLGGEVIELLGPDGLRSDPETTSGLKTFQAAGGTQALRRTEVVLVSLDGGRPIALRRPNILGAILIKARVLAKHRRGKFESDRQDLIRLLSYCEDPRALAKDMSKKEKGFLARIEGDLDLDRASHSALLPESTLVRARQAFRLLTI